MTQQQEMAKLMNVLHRMAKNARMNQWTANTEDADDYNVGQYNRILDRMQVLAGANATSLFAPLPQKVSWSTLANACRDLSAYYEDEANGQRRDGWHGWSGVWADRRGIWIDRSAFSHGLPQEVNELGQFIREKIAEWQDRKRPPQA